MENVFQKKENIDFNNFIKLSNKSFNTISNDNDSKIISCQPSHSTSYYKSYYSSYSYSSGSSIGYK